MDTTKPLAEVGSSEGLGGVPYSMHRAAMAYFAGERIAVPSAHVQGALIAALDAAPQPPEREPVAWQCRSKGNGTWGPGTSERIARELAAEGHEVRALFAGPLLPLNAF